MLLDGHGVVGPTFDCGVVGHNHALRPVDSTDAGNDSGRGNLSKLVHSWLNWMIQKFSTPYYFRMVHNGVR